MVGLAQLREKPGVFRPLAEAQHRLAGAAGFEPANGGIKSSQREFRPGPERSESRKNLRIFLLYRITAGDGINIVGINIVTRIVINEPGCGFASREARCGSRQ